MRPHPYQRQNHIKCPINGCSARLTRNKEAKKHLESHPELCASGLWKDCFRYCNVDGCDFFTIQLVNLKGHVRRKHPKEYSSMFQHQPTRTHSTEHEVTLNSPLPMQKTLPTTSPIVPVSGPIRFHNHHNVNPLDVSAITRPMPPLWGPLSSQYYTRTDPLYSWCLAPNPISVPTTSTNTMLGAPSVPCMTDSRFLNRLRDQDIRQSGMPLPY